MDVVWTQQISAHAIHKEGEYFPPFFGAVGKFLNLLAMPFYRSKASGALTPLFAATSPLVTQYDIRGEFLIPTPRFAMPNWISKLLDAICDPLFGVHIPEGLNLEPFCTGDHVIPTSSNLPPIGYNTLLGVSARSASVGNDLYAFTEAVIEYRIHVELSPLKNLMLLRAKTVFEFSVIFLMFGSLAKAVHGSLTNDHVDHVQPQETK
eukprot:762997-Hanusia_phi.AAC.8